VGIPQNNLTQEVPPRLNSILEMLKSVSKSRKAINVVVLKNNYRKINSHKQ
jgi:hypothetical protein